MRHQPHTAREAEHTAQGASVQALLRDAFSETPAPAPGFGAAVWARIDARRNPASWTQWLRGHMASVTAATAACVFVAVIGGGWLAHEQNRSQRETQLVRYISSIDAHAQLSAEAGTANPTLRQ